LIDEELLYSADPVNGSDGKTGSKNKNMNKTTTTTNSTTTDLSNNSTDWFTYAYEILTKSQSNNGSDEFGIEDLKQLGNIYSQSDQEKVVEGMKQDINSVTERQRRRDREREARVNKRINLDFNKIYDATKLDCNASKEKAENDIKRYAGTIRNQIYNILFLPIILLIFYNCYYMFFYTDVSGFKPSFIDIETRYYEPYVKPYLNFFLGIFIKPISILYYIFNLISRHKTLVRLSKEYPYYFFIILFIIVYSIISQSGKNVISTWGELLFGNKPNPFTPFALIVMGIYFVKDFILTLPEWKEDLRKPISGLIKFIMYWVIRFIVNILIFPYAGYLCTVYVFVYLFLGIYISQDSEPFDTINNINDTIYDKIYKAFDEKCGNKGSMAFIIKYFIRFLFMYLFEITLIILLFISIGVFREKINNPNVLAFLFSVILSLLFIIGVWCLTKYYTVLPMLDKKYTLTSKSYFQNKKEDPAVAAAEAAAEAKAEAEAEAAAKAEAAAAAAKAEAAAAATGAAAAAATNATVNATENTTDLLSGISGLFAALLGAP
jgi:F0F1-type ATP synthase membrane subunit b/b'